MKTLLYLLMVLPVFLTGCKKAPEPSATGGVSIHLVTSPAMTNYTALDNATVLVANDPLITYDDIESYAPATYILRLKPSAIPKLQTIAGDIPLSGKPFALVVDGRVLYYGVFFSPISSLSAAYPFITLDKNALSGSSSSINFIVGFRNSVPLTPERPDLRNAGLLLDRLRSDNKLK